MNYDLYFLFRKHPSPKKQTASNKIKTIRKLKNHEIILTVNVQVISSVLNITAKQTILKKEKFRHIFYYSTLLLNYFMTYPFLQRYCITIIQFMHSSHILFIVHKNHIFVSIVCFRFYLAFVIIYHHYTFVRNNCKNCNSKVFLQFTVIYVINMCIPVKMNYNFYIWGKGGGCFPNKYP